MANCNFKILSVCFVVLFTLSNCQSNGEEADARELRDRYPYMVALRNFGRFDCGGVLIGCHTVLTAAQCVDERHGRDRLPELWLNTYQVESFNNGTLIRHPTDVRVHPNFTGDVVDGYDYAILLLEEAATGLVPIRRTANYTLRLEVGEDNIRVLGFGRSTRTSSRSPYLQISHLEMLPIETCRNERELIVFEDQMLCLEGDTPCSGDQGGPVFRNGPSAPNDHLVGIVSATACDLNSRLSTVPSILQPHVFDWITTTVHELESSLPNYQDPDAILLEQFDSYFDAESSTESLGFDEDFLPSPETIGEC